MSKESPDNKNSALDDAEGADGETTSLRLVGKITHKIPSGPSVQNDDSSNEEEYYRDGIISKDLKPNCWFSDLI